MAKDKTKKGKDSSGSTRGRAPTAAVRTRRPATTSRAAKVQKVVKGAKKLAANPATSEVIAATLVAAAAALRDPKKARALASEAADDLRQAAKEGVEGGALWQLALDVARRSIDTIGAEGGKARSKLKDKGKAKAKEKAKAKGKKLAGKTKPGKAAKAK